MPLHHHVGRFLVRELLPVVGTIEVRDALARQRRAARGVDQAVRMLGAVDLLVEHGHVFEQPQQVHFLLVMHAHHVVIGLPGDRQHGRAVHLGVVKTIEQVDRAGPAGGNADAEPTRELGVAAGHERRALLVSHLHEADAFAQLPQPLHEAIDAVAGQAEDHINPPGHQPIKKDVRRGFGHGSSSLLC